eukprot:TRINITY_DN1330_c0_g1_i4.p1 TRINITY_DN1330_c0_g1~~TRINITY_DN1330_c0_g1_i4.p1  ORF type:complete len:377 (+),score=56.84 TRINITY_DN1330_c0_g1_i4:114-1244(+)
MNKEEAQRSFEIGLEHYQKGRYQNALKFFQISQRLDATELTAGYIKKCEEFIHNGSKPAPEARNGTQSVPSAQPVNENAGRPDYTEEQLKEVKRLNGLKDFYEILGVSKTANEDEIKKSYRKLALKLHPDKNPAPGAKEAFTKLGQAYDCLSNKEKRQYYDTHGTADPEEHVRQYRQHYHDDFFNPEDIFDMFFGFSQGPRRRGHGHGRGHTTFYYTNFGGQRQAGQGQGQGQQQQKGGLVYILQFLPLILLLLSSVFFSSGWQDESLYSFQPNYKFNQRRLTRRLEVPYWVQPDFARKYSAPRDLAKVESDVEENYMRALYRECETAKAQSEKLRRTASYYSGRDREKLLQMAGDVDLGSCVRLTELNQQAKRRY